MKRVTLLTALLLVAAPASAQICKGVFDANGTLKGQICANRPIQGGDAAAEILRRLPTMSNAANWPPALAPAIESGGNDATPGRLTWLDFPPPAVRTKLDGSSIEIPYPQLGPVWGVVHDNSGSAASTVVEGPPGPAGTNGSDGSIGPRGPRGFTGPSGLTGRDGRDGQQGLTGATGPQGNNGTTGATGPQGATGQQGIQGVGGAPGVNGTNGINGATGATGPQGLTGPQGPQGQRGPRGRPRRP